MLERVSTYLDSRVLLAAMYTRQRRLSFKKLRTLTVFQASTQAYCASISDVVTFVRSLDWLWLCTSF